MLFLQLLVDGLQLGALYALMAVGFAMIFGSTRVFHYAHGTTYVIVGYLFYYMAERVHLPWWAAAIIAGAIGVLFGVLLDRWMYRPIQRDEGSFFTVFVASFGIAVVAENIIVILFGAKLAPNRMTMMFSATTAMPNEATNTVKNEPSSRWIGRYIQRSSSTPNRTPIAPAMIAAAHHGRCTRSAM